MPKPMYVKNDKCLGCLRLVNAVQVGDETEITCTLELGGIEGVGEVCGMFVANRRTTSPTFSGNGIPHTETDYIKNTDDPAPSAEAVMDEVEEADLLGKDPEAKKEESEEEEGDEPEPLTQTDISILTEYSRPYDFTGTGYLLEVVQARPGQITMWLSPAFAIRFNAVLSKAQQSGMDVTPLLAAAQTKGETAIADALKAFGDQNSLIARPMTMLGMVISLGESMDELFTAMPGIHAVAQLPAPTEPDDDDEYEEDEDDDLTDDDGQESEDDEADDDKE